MKAVKRVLLGLAVLAIVIAGVGLMLPRQVVVERSTRIDAPAATVFALVNGFTHFNAFSPWADLDPDTAYTYAGPRHGVGASMKWRSENPHVGNGRQEVIESVPHEQVVCALEFDGRRALASFWLKPEGGSTLVTWRFETDLGNDIIGRWFGLLFDRMIGADYEKGLASLKALAEDYPAIDIADLDVSEVTLTRRPLLLARRTASVVEDGMLVAMEDAYGSLRSFLAANNVTVPAEAIIITREWSETDNTWTFDAAYPLPADAVLDVEGTDVALGESWQGAALRSIVRGGDYAESAAMYEKIALYIELHGYEIAGDSWEAYRSDPLATPPEALVTEIFFPVK
ncbi:MAG TPA: SRPBCC family protein [Gammaproteobacteria bacterium]